jgi:phospholipid/cholesterol/gamma-HCH transport system substrate-binding protein
MALSLKISREVRIGILVIFTLACSVWGFNYLKGIDLFTRHTYFYVIYPNSAGIEVSAPIVVNGFKVGQVASTEFMGLQGGQILVKLRISEKNLFIPQDTDARISTPGFLSAKVIDLRLGQSASFAKSGDTLRGTLEEDLSTQVSNVVQPLKEKAERLLGNIDSLIVPLQVILTDGGMENIRRSFESIPRIIRNIEHATHVADTVLTAQQSKLAKIIGNIESISTNLKENEQNISNMLSNFSDLSDTLKQANVGQVVAEANRSIKHLSTILQEISQGDGSLSALINDRKLYAQLDSAAMHLNHLLEDMKENPDRYIHFSLIHVNRKQKKQ